MRALALLVAALFATPSWADPTPAPAPGVPGVPSAGSRKSAPDFELKDLSGKRVRLSSLAGKVVVVSFWATWCAPCLQELPHLDRIQAEHGDQVVILAINTDAPDSLPQVRTIVKRQKFRMPILLDQEGKVASLLNPRGTNPFTVLIDRAGRIAESHEGYTSGDEKTYAKWVAALVSER